MTVQGLSRLSRKLRRTIPTAAKKRAKEALEASAEEIIALMKRLVPKDEGNLAESIGWTWGNVPKGAVALGRSEPTGNGRLRITIYAGGDKTVVTNSRGVEFQNVFIQEFGTQEQDAQPFFFPAWRALRRRAKSRVSRGITKGVKEGAQ